MKPPIRLREDPQIPPELRADLQRSATATPKYDVAAGLLGLQAAIGAPLPTAASSASAASSAGSGSSAASGAAVAGSAGAGGKVGLLSALSAGSIKAVLVGVVATGGAAALTSMWVDGSRTHMAPIAADPPRAPRPNSSPSAAAGPQVVTPVATPQAATPEDAAQAAGPTAHPAPVSSNPTDDPAQAALRSEIAQLGRIKALVDGDPRRALELVRAGQREFATGILRHEREALAVRALWNMGSREAARREARRFLERYPHSPLRPRIEQLLREER
jgi:hypothetical protein